MSMTKISQSQIKGTGKADLGTELSAVEEAIKAAVGGASYESRAELSLADIGGLISKEADGRLGLDVNVKGNGFSVGGLTGVSAVTASFQVTHAGYVDGTVATFSTTHAGAFDASSAFVAGPLEVSGTSVFRENVAADKDVTIGGNLYVNGSTVSMDTVSVQIADNNLVIAKGKPSLAGGEGFSLVDDAGSHFMHWDASGKWSISDGILSPAAVLGSKVQVDDKGVKSLAGNPLAIKAATVMQFQDSFMAGPMDLSKAGEFAPVFGPGAWADGLGLIGALNKAHLDAAAALVVLSGSSAQALANEISRAKAAEQVLQDHIDAEASTRAAQDALHDGLLAGLRTDLGTETSNRTAADVALGQRIDTEISDRQAAVSTEAQARQSADSALGVRIDTEISDRQTAVSTEATARQSADNALGVRIDGLQVTVDANYSTLDGKITAEKNRAEGIEGGLRTDLTSEISRAQVAEGVLDGKITTEKNRAEGAELVLTNAIATEKTRAEGAELVLTNAIAAEKSRAEGVEAGLRTDLNSEISRAQTAEGVLDGKITALKGDIASQALRLFVAVVPNGPDLAADSNLTGYAGAEFVMPVGKASANYDVYLNGQQMMWNQDFVFVAGKVQFKFALKAGDVVRFREF